VIRKRAIATICMPGTLADKLGAAAEAGYQGIEIFENDPTYFDGRPEDVRGLAGSLGLEIIALQPFRSSRPRTSAAPSACRPTACWWRGSGAPKSAPGVRSRGRLQPDLLPSERVWIDHVPLPAHPRAPPAGARRKSWLLSLSLSKDPRSSTTPWGNYPCMISCSS
jgi:hypothetical protein